MPSRCACSGLIPGPGAARVRPAGRPAPQHLRQQPAPARPHLAHEGGAACAPRRPAYRLRGLCRERRRRPDGGAVRRGGGARASAGSRRRPRPRTAPSGPYHRWCLAETFQPMNVNFGLFPPPPEGTPKHERKAALARRALAALSCLGISRLGPLSSLAFRAKIASSALTTAYAGSACPEPQHVVVVPRSSRSRPARDWPRLRANVEWSGGNSRRSKHPPPRPGSLRSRCAARCRRCCRCGCWRRTIRISSRFCVDKIAHSPDFFRNAPLVLDVGALAGREPLDFALLAEHLRQHRLMPVGIQNGSPAWNEAAMAAGPRGVRRRQRPRAAPERRSGGGTAAGRTRRRPRPARRGWSTSRCAAASRSCAARRSGRDGAGQCRGRARRRPATSTSTAPCAAGPSPASRATRPP